MKNSLQRLLFGKLSEIVRVLEDRFGDDFRKLTDWEKYEMAIRFYNSQKTMIQQYRFILDLVPLIISLWALMRTFSTSS